MRFTIDNFMFKIKDNGTYSLVTELSGCDILRIKQGERFGILSLTLDLDGRKKKFSPYHILNAMKKQNLVEFDSAELVGLSFKPTEKLKFENIDIDFLRQYNECTGGLPRTQIKKAK